MNGCLTSLTSREMQIKATVRYHSTSIRMATIKIIDNTKFCQGCRETESLVHCWWVNGTVTLENSSSVWHKVRISLTTQESHSWVPMLEQWFAIHVPPEVLKHGLTDYLVRGTDLFSLRLSNKSKMMTVNTIIAIRFDWIKIIPTFWHISKNIFFWCAAEF